MSPSPESTQAVPTHARLSPPVRIILSGTLGFIIAILCAILSFNSSFALLCIPLFYLFPPLYPVALLILYRKSSQSSRKKYFYLETLGFYISVLIGIYCGLLTIENLPTDAMIFISLFLGILCLIYIILGHFLLAPPKVLGQKK